MLRSKGVLTGAVIVMAGLVLAACSSNGSSSATNATTSAATGATAPTSGGASGGGNRNITVQLYQLPDGFNPLELQTGGVALIEELHWDALVGLNDKSQVAGRLADSWDISSDAKTITFHLKSGLKWSDGTPFTSKDVLYSFNTLANPKTGSTFASYFSNVVGADAVSAGTATTVSGFSAPDDNTFVVKLVQPNSAWVVTIGEPAIYVFPEHIVSKFPVQDLVKNPWWREPTVGLGPYVFDKWVNDNEIELDANPNYRTPLGADHVYASYLTSDAALAQLQAGQLDYAQVAVSDMATAKAMKNVNVVTAPGASVMALHTAIDNGKLADKRVRQAIMYGINRQGIVDQVLKGQGKVINTLVFGPEWAVPSGLNDYPYNPDKAKQLLADAGWKASTEVDLVVTPGQKDRDTMVTIVTQQLKQIGMNVVVKQVTPAEQTPFLQGRTFDLLPSQYGLFNVDPVTMDPRLMCDQAYPKGSNITAYCNKDLDTLLLQGIATTDQSKRQQTYAQVQKIFNEEMPIMVLYSPNIIAANSARLQGFKLAGVLTQAFWNAADWTVSG